LVATRTTLTANDSANTLVITDTQANIHRLAQIIKAMEASAAGITMIRIFRLQNADAQETADLISNMFPSSERSSENQAPFQFQGPPPGPGGPVGLALDAQPVGGDQNATKQRSRRAAQVTAVADPRTSAVVVSAPDNLMGQIADIVTSLDV